MSINLNRESFGLQLGYQKSNNISSMKNNEDHDLSFRSKGKEVVIGGFLNQEDKVLLKEEIFQIIQRLNNLGFAN